jgi:hypothetical protein
MNNSNIIYLSPIFFDTNLFCAKLTGENSVENIEFSFGGVHKLIKMIKPYNLIWHAPFNGSLKMLNNVELDLKDTKNYKKSVIIQGSDTKTSFTEDWKVDIDTSQIKLNSNDILVVSYAEDFSYNNLIECRAGMVAIDFSGRYQDINQLKQVLRSFGNNKPLLLSLSDHDKYINHDVILNITEEFHNTEILYHDPKKIAFYSKSVILDVENEFFIKTFARIGLGDYLLYRLVRIWAESSISYDSIKSIQSDIYNLIKEGVT